MKRLIMLLFVAGLALTGTAWAQQAESTSASKSPPGETHAEAVPTIITSDEVMELHEARSAAIRAHPELIADMQKLMEKSRVLEARINAAMIKADPGIAPLIAKVEARRNRQPEGMSPSPSPANPPPVK